METFILKTLRKIRKEVPRRFKELRIVCDDLIGRIMYCEMNLTII